MRDGRLRVEALIPPIGTLARSFYIPCLWVCGFPLTDRRPRGDVEHLGPLRPRRELVARHLLAAHVRDGAVGLVVGRLPDDLPVLRGPAVVRDGREDI